MTRHGSDISAVGALRSANLAADHGQTRVACSLESEPFQVLMSFRRDSSESRWAGRGVDLSFNHATLPCVLGHTLSQLGNAILRSWAVCPENVLVMAVSLRSMALDIAKLT